MMWFCWKMLLLVMVQILQARARLSLLSLTYLLFLLCFALEYISMIIWIEFVPVEIKIKISAGRILKLAVRDRNLDFSREKSQF